MRIEEFLGLLQNVKEVGRGRWVATCPSHQDRRPSLAVDEGQNGTILAFCRAGCSFQDIIGALRVDEREMFGDSDRDEYRKRADGAPPEPTRREIAMVLDQEALVVELCAQHILDHSGADCLTPEMRRQLEKAASRIAAIHRAFRGWR